MSSSARRSPSVTAGPASPALSTSPSAGAGWRWASRVTIAVAVVASVAAMAGLLVADVYGEPAATAQMLRGYDLVTLVVVVPALVMSLLRAHRGSDRAVLIWMGLLAYLAYTYAYYLFGTGFNDLLLLHAVVFAGSLAGLILTLVCLDPSAVAAGLSERAPVRAVAAVLALLAAALGVMWVWACVAYALTGAIPAGSALVETDLVVHLGIVLDLTVLVPLYAVAGVLLWQRQPWGFVLAAFALISGLLHQVSYLVALLFQYAAGVPGSVAVDPVEPVIVLLYAAAAVALLVGRPSRRASTGGG